MQTDYEFLDKELQQMVRDAKLGRRLVDKLVKVYRKNTGQETWVLIHVEVQGFHEKVFEKRMYIYNYRLFDRYEQPICSLAVLADERKDWQPTQFHYDIWGCEVNLKFPAIKLLNYRKRELELEESTNPFAIVGLPIQKLWRPKSHLIPVFKRFLIF